MPSHLPLCRLQLIIETTDKFKHLWKDRASEPPRLVQGCGIKPWTKTLVLRRFLWLVDAIIYMLTHHKTRILFGTGTDERTAKEHVSILRDGLSTRVEQVLRLSTPMFVFQKMVDGQCFIGEAMSAWNDMVAHTTAALSELPGYCDAMHKEWTSRCQQCPS